MQHTAILPATTAVIPLPVLQVMYPTLNRRSHQLGDVMPRFRLEGDLSREGIGVAIETLIATLDAADGDPDLEEGGDEEPKSADGDSGDQSWAEASRGAPIAGREDDEDGGDTEANGDEHDGGGAEDEEIAYFKTLGNGPGCIVSDPDFGVEDEGHDPDEGV